MIDNTIEPIWNGIDLEDNTRPVFIFESGGINYFQIADPYAMYYERAVQAQDIYQELDNRVDNEFLKATFNTILVAVDRGELNKIGYIANGALQRLDYISHIDLMYKLASVKYFDENENPIRYDWEYNTGEGGKIDKWKKNKDIEGFFLKAQLESYLPSLDTTKMPIPKYTKAQRLEEKGAANFFLQLLSKKPENADISKYLMQRVARLSKLINLND